MANKSVVEIVTEMVYRVIYEINFELVDVEFVKDGINWYLRVYIDKEGGINIDDCQIVSEYLNKELDKSDFIKQSYS